MPYLRGGGGSSGPVVWADILNKPVIFPPGVHGHAIADTAGLQAGLDAKASAVHTHPWAEVTSKPATFPPDSHSHTYASLTGTPDLSTLPTTGQKNALAGTQGTPGVTNQYVTTQDLRNSDARTPLAHQHPQADITNLTTDLAARQATSQKGQPNGYADLDATGKIPALQLPVAVGGFSWTAVLRQAADATQATAAFNTTQGPVFSFEANATYVVELFLLMRSSLVTAGFRLALDTSVAVTAVGLSFNHVLANTGTITAGQSRADATATGLSSGVDTINVDTPVIGGGVLVTAGTIGTARLVFGPEVAATATLRAGSVMRVHKAA